MITLNIVKVKSQIKLLIQIILMFLKYQNQVMMTLESMRGKKKLNKTKEITRWRILYAL